MDQKMMDVKRQRDFTDRNTNLRLRGGHEALRFTKHAAV